jgi:hypothetical protein
LFSAVELLKQGNPVMKLRSFGVDTHYCVLFNPSVNM